MDADKKRFVITVGGKEVDLTEVPALTLGDKKVLKKDGLDFTKYIRDRAIEPDDEIKLVTFILRKMNSQVTSADVEAMPAMNATRVVEFFLKRSSDVDDPFSTRSTSSGLSTAGPSAT